MLRFLSRQQRARNALLIFICFGLAISMFIAFGMPIGNWFSRTANKGAGVSETDVVAQVDAYEITAGELQKSLSRISSQGGQNFSFIKSFSDEMLDQLIQQRIEMLEAKRLGINVTDDEVRWQIARRYPGFLQPDGRFVRYADYRRRLESSGITIEEFESSERQYILDQKLRSFITASIDVTSREVEEDYVRQNTSLDLAYLVIDPQLFENKVEISDSEAKTYFDQHREDFKIDELERQIDYLFIPFEPLQKKVKVSKEELRQEYDRSKNQYTIGAWVSQIVFPFTTTNEAAIRRKADLLVKKARGSEKTPAEDFAKLGGKSIGYVKKAPKDTSYRQRVFLLRDQQKDITDVIREENNFYVLKVNRWKRKPLGQVRRELRQRLRERKARSEASKLASEIKGRLKETDDLQKVAQQFRSRLGNPPLQDMVRHTGFFGTSDQLAEFGVYSSSFTSASANLDEIGQVGNQVFLKDGLAIPRLAAKREPHAPTFEEVKDRVSASLRQERAKQQARQRAEEILRKAPTVKALKRVAKTARLEMKTQEDFKRGSLLSGLTRSEQLEGFAFQTQVNQVAPHVIKLGDKFVILGVTKRKEADLTKLSKEFDEHRKQLLNQRRVQFYQAYLDNIKDQLAAEGRIIVYEKVFNTITALPTGNL